MTTSYDAAVGLGTPGAGDSPYIAVLDANRALIALYLANLAVRPTEIPSTTLNVKVASGVFQKQDETVATYAGTASYALTASSTRMLWLTEAGLLSNGVAWPTAGTFHVRLAVVVVGATTITSVTPWQSIPRSVSS